MLEEVDADLERLVPAGLIAALKRLDELSARGRRHPYLLERAARGWVLLTLQSNGLDDLRDQIEGRALAMLTLAGEGYALQNMEAEEALLANRLGYREHALRTASQLPVEHPVRLYLQGSLTDLRQAVERASRQESPLVRYLHLRRLAEAGLIKDWTHWASRHFPSLTMALPVLSSRAEEGTSAVQNASLWERTLDLTRIELARAADELNPGLEKLFPSHSALARQWAPERIRPMLWQGGNVSIEQFESLLDRLEGLYSGPFLDAPALVSYFRSIFYLALHRLAEQSLQQQACSAEFPLDEPYLTTAAAGVRAAQLQAWYQEEAQTRSAEDRPALHDELMLETLRGASSLTAALESHLQAFSYDDQHLAEVSRKILGRLDNRPSHRQTRCLLRYRVGLKALADGFRLQAADWFGSLDELGCSQAISAQELGQLARQSQLLALQSEQSE